MAADMMYRYILNGVKDGVYFVDTERKITFWNKAAEEITGFTADEVNGKYCFNNILNHVDDEGCQLCMNGCPLHKTLDDGEIRDATVYLHHKEGHRVPVTVHIMPIYEGHKIIGAVETFSDNADRVRFLSSMNELKVLAYQDQLTQLPNRRYLESIIDAKQREYLRLNIPYAIALLDIDHFKFVNDTHGHDVGDDVLQMVSKVFKASIRNDDVIGRWGGEEFLAIFGNINVEELEKILERIRMLVESSSLRGEDEVKVTISIGASIVTEHDSTEDLVKRADAMLYKSKTKGRNRVTLD
jgi:diguanylate cyclase (GGDEF)-like protein/PAS domain S-box-containing protein